MQSETVSEQGQEFEAFASVGQSRVGIVVARTFPKPTAPLSFRTDDESSA
jgi:hypothetical protein